MKLYDYFRSTASYRVRIALHWKQIRYEKKTVHLIQHGGEQHNNEYLSLNPQAMVPTLEDDGQVLTQSLAIIEYLEDTHPNPPLLPGTALDKAHIRSLALIIACDIHPLNNLRVLNRLRSTFQAKEEQITHWYHHWLKLGFDALELKLKQFPRSLTLCYGNHVTLADVCLIPQVYNAHRFNFSMDNYPIIQSIYDYCLTIPAFKNTFPQE